MIGASTSGSAASRPPVRLLFAAGSAALGARTIRRLAGSVLAMRAVAPDLRTPVLLLPIAPRSMRHLRLMRDRIPTNLPVPPGVTLGAATAEVEGREPVRVLTYDRADRPQPTGALVWIHGGGTVLGKPELGNIRCGRWVADLDLLAISVDYRLAPEHPFPAPLEDCYTALLWLHQHAGELGVDPDRIVVGGDSAGGLLAASLAQLARDRRGPPIRLQLLEYPMLDDRTALRTDFRPEQSYVWSPEASRFGWTAYLGATPTRGADGRGAAPARTVDLAGLPPAWIGVGDLDLLHDEAVEYATRLDHAGVPVELLVEPGMYHAADAIRANASTSRRFVDRMTAALASAVHP